MKRKLLFYPHPMLRQKAHEVRDFNVAELTSLAQDMRTIMKENNGMGLAAVQVGDPRRVIIIEFPGDKESGDPAIPFTILVNPKITKLGKKTDRMNEGCLSVPSVEVPIDRATEATIIAQDVAGKPARLRAKGLLARILQHEIDHLNGTLIIDYAKKEKATTTLKTVVWGSTSFTTQVLNTVMQNPLLDVTHIVTESPKPSGRDKELTPTIARTYADTLGIPALEPHTLTDERFLSYLKAQQPDLMIVAAYGKLLPKEVLEIPTYGCLNVHPSLLPKYRGASPIQAAILSGDRETGVTIIQMSPEFDTGAMIAQSSVTLDGTETYGDLEPMLAELGGEMINEIIPYLMKGQLQPMPQDESKATYTKKIKPEDRWLNPEDSVEVNERKVRAFAPSPNAFVQLDGQTLKVLAAHREGDQLVFDTVQPAGKRPMPWADFLHGYRKPLQFEPYKSILSK